MTKNSQSGVSEEGLDVGISDHELLDGVIAETPCYRKQAHHALVQNHASGALDALDFAAIFRFVILE